MPAGSVGRLVARVREIGVDVTRTDIARRDLHVAAGTRGMRFRFSSFRLFGPDRRADERTTLLSGAENRRVICDTLRSPSLRLRQRL
jgi:hypothetical protein